MKHNTGVATRQHEIICLDKSRKDMKVPGRGRWKMWLPEAIQRLCFGDGLGYSGKTAITAEQLVKKQLRKRGVLATATQVMR